MKNIITASLEFSFKGETLRPASTIDLDMHIQGTGCVPDLYMLLAKDNNIDLYSYEYEMLQAEDIHIEKAEGLVANYVTDGILDIPAFEQAWQEQQVHETIQKIIAQHGLSHVIDQYPDLNKALLAIYKAGQGIISSAAD